MKFRNMIHVLTIFVVIIVGTIAGLWFYYDDLQKDLAAQAHKTLNEIIEQQRFNFKSEIEAQMGLLETTATLISYLGDDHNQILAALRKTSQKSQSEFLVIADTKGRSINSKGEIVDISGRDYYEAALKNETFISMPVDSLIGDDVIIPLAVPIVRDGIVYGVLMGAYSTERFNQLLLPSYDGMGYTFVVDSEGEIIAKTQNEHMIVTTGNLFEPWMNDDTQFYNFDDLETILSNVKQCMEGHADYSIEEEIRLMHYSPLDVNDWYIFAAIPQDVISKNAANITDKAGRLAAGIIICFVFFICYIFLIQRKSAHMEKENVCKLERIAYVDALTGNRNYNKFKLDAQNILMESQYTAYILVKADIENFKLINMIYGFEMGNRVLQAVSQAIASVLPEADGIFARLAVDEFIILQHFYNWEKQQEIQDAVVRRFYEQMGANFHYKVLFKIGQYIINKEQAKKADITEYFEMVNVAHRRAKQNATLNVVFYDESMSREALKQKEIENNMEQALENEEFKVYLQPKYRLQDETVGGVEALVRWEQTAGGLLNPGDFIPVFEKNGFITKLDLYMYKKVCALVRGWQASGLTPVVVSVNFSRLHLSDSGFVDSLCQIADSFGVSRAYLEIEITETAIFENLKRFEEVLLKLHQAGFTLSMDDFGSGYSSLGLLKNLPVDVIKLDRSFFVRQMDEQRTRIVVANVVRMAKELSIHTVAEGVEDRVNIDFLRELGCDMVQGYYYAKPMPERTFTQTLLNK